VRDTNFWSQGCCEGLLVFNSLDAANCAQNAFRGRHGVDLSRGLTKGIVGSRAQIIENLVGRE
jgi:hypothetical protein